MRIFVCQHWPPFYDVHPNKHVRIHHLDLIKIFVFKNISVANMPHLVNLHRLSFLNIQIFFQRTGTFRIYDKTSNMLKGGAKIQSFSNLLTTKLTIILFMFTVESTKSLPCHVLQYTPLTLFEVVPNWQALILVQLSSPVILLVPGTLSESEPSGAELFCVLQQHKMFLNVYNMKLPKLSRYYTSRMRMG